MIPKQMRTHLNEYLFSFPNSQSLCIIDTTTIPGFDEALSRNSNHAYSLTSGKILEANSGPVVICLNKNSAFTDWLFDLWGQQLGFYCVLDQAASIETFCNYFNKLSPLLSEQATEAGSTLTNPLRLDSYLLKLNANSVKQALGPVRLFMLEASEPFTVKRYWSGENGIETEQSTFEPTPPDQKRPTPYADLLNRKCVPGSGCC